MERISPNVPQAVVALAQLGQLVRIRRALERQQFEGAVAEITLACTDQQQFVVQSDYPFLEQLATAVFFNDGPDTAYISVNNSNLPFTVKKNESHPIDFSKADRRIEHLSYWCDVGNTAAVRLGVKY